MKKIIIHAFAALLVVMPVGATALTVDVGANASTEARVVSTTTGAKVDVVVGSEGSTNVETPSGVMVEVDRSGSGGATVTVEGRTTGDPDFDLLRAKVEVLAKKDAMVRGVDVDADGEVEVAYKHPGRLFGVIPIVVTSRTTVETDAEGKVAAKVRLPWWSFLVSGVSEVRSGAEAALNADAGVAASAEATADVNARVKLVEAIVTSLQKADAAVKAGYNVKANVK